MNASQQTHPSPQEFDTDVLVVGGGLAGLAAAIAARQQGLSVIVADSTTPTPNDEDKDKKKNKARAWGEGLMPPAQAALAELGLSIPGSETGIFHGIKFIGPEGSVLARFPRGQGIGIRRATLHQALLEHADRLGVQTLWDNRICGLQEAGVRVGSRIIRTRWLIGADGQHSRVRNWAGLSAGRQHSQRIVIRQHFEIEPISDFVEIYWGSQGQAHVTPLGKKEICVSLISKKRFVSFDAGIAQFPVLARHLGNAARSTSLPGAISTFRRLRAVFRGRIALIGEASGSVDAVTGEGLAMTFRQAIALSQALRANDLSLYQAAHRRISSPPSFMSRSMLLLDKSSWIRRHTLRAFARKPALFERFLSVHVGESGLRNFGIRGILNLGWQLLVA